MEKSDSVIKMAAEAIKQGEVEVSRIANTVLVIDEAQDMDEHEFRLIQALISRNEDMRVIAVGDDDQNIYSFRGSNSKYMQQLLQYEKSTLYELVENYRSKANIVEFTNIFVTYIQNRLKKMCIMAHRNENGKIQIVEYRSRNFLIPAVSRFQQSDNLKGTVCFLTNTNEESLLVLALLEKANKKASLIQGNEKFDLSALAEIRYFVALLDLKENLYLIGDDKWNFAKRKFRERYKGSTMYPMCMKLLSDFEAVNREYKYISDFRIYLKESREEDFSFTKEASVYVSTIHKAKGREFDHVILILNDFYINQDSSKRALYVGMTRAKENLIIHTNQTYFGTQRDLRYTAVKGVDYVIDQYEYPAPNLIRMQLGYRDVVLSYFYQNQNAVSSLMSGDPLYVDESGCYDKEHRKIVIFSKRFKANISEKAQKGYHLYAARVREIFYWEEKEKEVMAVIPTVDFVKRSVRKENSR